jgi:hypothetical protein
VAEKTTLTSGSVIEATVTPRQSDQADFSQAAYCSGLIDTPANKIDGRLKKSKLAADFLLP